MRDLDIDIEKNIIQFNGRQDEENNYRKKCIFKLL